MTDREYPDMQSIVTFQETLALKTEALRNGLSHWWLDVHEGQGIQPGTRNELQCAIADMREWLDAIDGLVNDPQEQEHEMPGWAQPQ